MPHLFFFTKLISLGSFLISASLVSYSFTYFFENAVSEVYGFIYARRLIWSAIICGNAFTIYCNIILKAPSPAFANHDSILSQVISGNIRSGIAGTIAMLAGSYISVYIISKTKIFFLGRRYWIRTFFASALGEAVNTLIVFPIGMLGLMSNHNLIKIIYSAYVLKLIFVMLQIIPSVLFVYFLKRIEKIDFYDKNTDFNPFKF